MSKIKANDYMLDADKWESREFGASEEHVQVASDADMSIFKDALTMTNTNELTAKLKAAAPYEMKFSRLWERYDEACHGNAEHMRDILELTLDALETAERRIAKSDRDVRALTEALEAAEKRIAEQREYYESVIADGSMRIAELEARTLTVKLPHWSGYTCSGEGAMLDACVRSLESQGFTVQIEGE